MAFPLSKATATPETQAPRRILALGSITNLNHTQYFWSGNTLETLRFHDRRCWILHAHINGRHPIHPGETLHKTTLQDIIDIIKSLDHPSVSGVPHLPVFQVHPDGTNNLHVYPNSHGWVLMYLEGDEKSTLAFRQPVLERFPPQDSDNRNTCTALEMYVRGIDPYLRTRLGRWCPPSPQTLIFVMMKVCNQVPIQKADDHAFFTSYE